MVAKKKKLGQMYDCHTHTRARKVEIQGPYERFIVEALDKVWGLVFVCVGLVGVFELQSGHVKHSHYLWPRVPRLSAEIGGSGKYVVIGMIYVGLHDW